MGTWIMALLMGSGVLAAEPPPELTGLSACVMAYGMKCFVPVTNVSLMEILTAVKGKSWSHDKDWVLRVDFTNPVTKTPAHYDIHCEKSVGGAAGGPVNIPSVLFSHVYRTVKNPSGQDVTAEVDASQVYAQFMDLYATSKGK